MPRTIKKVLREEEIAAPANTSRKRGDKNALGMNSRYKWWRNEKSENISHKAISHIHDQ